MNRRRKGDEEGAFSSSFPGNGVAPFFLALVLVLSGCATSTNVVDSWAAPDAAPPAQLKRIAVVAIAQDRAVRRLTEDEMVRRVKGATAVQSYTLMDQPTTPSLDGRSDVFRDFDGAVTLRVVGTNITDTWVAGSYPSPYYSFSRYYFYAWPQVYHPENLLDARVIRVEANVYALPDQKLLWTGLTETFHSSSLHSLFGVIADSVTAKMREQQLLP